MTQGRVIDNLSTAVECANLWTSHPNGEITKLTIWFEDNPLICQNKFIYEEQYSSLFLFVK